MDRTTPLAIAGALFAVFFAMIVDGSSPTILFKPAPLILVFGGTIAAAVAGFMKKDVKSIKDVFKAALGVPESDHDQNIARIVQLAEVARREGLLALEKMVADLDDPFFRKGVELTVDGVDPEEMEEILVGELAALKERHAMGAKFFSDMGGFSPTLGIIGTVIGLIHVLSTLSDPNAVAPAIGSAFTATLWGVLAANLLWLPIANKLKRASNLEVHEKQMIIDGLLAVQAGSSPRMVQARLQAYLPAQGRGEGPARSEEAA